MFSQEVFPEVFPIAQRIIVNLQGNEEKIFNQGLKPVPVSSIEKYQNSEAYRRLSAFFSTGPGNLGNFDYERSLHHILNDYKDTPNGRNSFNFYLKNTPDLLRSDGQSFHLTKRKKSSNSNYSIDMYSLNSHEYYSIKNFFEESVNGYALRKETTNEILSSASAGASSWDCFYANLGLIMKQYVRQYGVKVKLPASALSIYHRSRVAMFFSSILFRSFDSLVIYEESESQIVVSPLNKIFDETFFSHWMLYNMNKDKAEFLKFILSAAQTIYQTKVHYMVTKLNQLKDVSEPRPSLFAFIFFMQRLGLLLGHWWMVAGGDNEVIRKQIDDFRDSVLSPESFDQVLKTPSLLKAAAAIYFCRGCISQAKAVWEDSVLEKKTSSEGNQALEKKDVLELQIVSPNQDFLSAMKYGGFRAISFTKLLQSGNGINFNWNTSFPNPIFEDVSDYTTNASNYNVCKEIYFKLSGLYSFKDASVPSTLLHNSIQTLTDIKSEQFHILIENGFFPYGLVKHTQSNSIHAVDFSTYTYYINGNLAASPADAIMELCSLCSKHGQESLYCKYISAGIQASFLTFNHTTTIYTAPNPDSRYWQPTFIPTIFSSKISLRVFKNGVMSFEDIFFQIFLWNYNSNVECRVMQLIDTVIAPSNNLRSKSKSEPVYLEYDPKIPSNLFNLPSNMQFYYFKGGNEKWHAVLNSNDFSGYFFIKQDFASLSIQAILDLGLSKESPNNDKDKENEKDKKEKTEKEKTVSCPMKFIESINFSNGFAGFEIMKLSDYRGIKLNSIVIPYDFQINGEYFLLEEHDRKFNAVLLNDFVVTTEFQIAAPTDSMSFIAMNKVETGKAPIYKVISQKAKYLELGL